MLLSISWRNIWRNKSRSLVILTAIALGLWGGVFSVAFMNGMAEQQIYSTIHTETGHLQLNATDFLLNYDITKAIPRADSAVANIRKIKGVAGVSAGLQMMAMASTAASSTGVMVHGVDPESKIQVSDLGKFMEKGGFLKDKGHNLIVIGAPLAEKLHAKPGYRIVLALQTVSGEITYAVFKVAGIFRTHDSDYDKQNVFVRKKELRDLIGFPKNEASTITVLLKNADETLPVKKQLQQRFPDLQVQDWQELSPMLRAMSGTMEQFSFLFLCIVLIALAFGIVNTMLMAVLDRTREIGMLLCIGMSPGLVFGMIVLETVLLSLTGAVCGTLLGIVSIGYFGVHGIDLSIIGEGANALGISSMVYPELGWDFYVKFAGLVTLIAIIAGLFPAMRGIRLVPAQAIRGE